MCMYYKKFVKGFYQLCAPLTDLTKKGAFKWNEEDQMTMDKMKKVMSTCPIPALLIRIWTRGLKNAQFSKCSECDENGAIASVSFS
jgi:hypothetical protein